MTQFCFSGTDPATFVGRASLTLAVLASLTLTAVEAEQHPSKQTSDPWNGLKVRSAPVFHFDGQNFYPIFVERKAGRVRWEFVRDNDSPDHPSRLIVLSILGNTNVAALEKSMLHTTPSLANSRQVHQRNAAHLQQSWWAGPDSKKSFHVLDWQADGSAVYSCELVSNEAVGPVSQEWRQNFEKVLQQARPFLRESEKL